MAGKVAEAIVAALDAQTVTLPAEATVGRVTAELDRLHRRRDALAGEIEEVFLAHPFGQILVTMPGIGPPQHGSEAVRTRPTEPVDDRASGGR